MKPSSLYQRHCQKFSLDPDQQQAAIVIQLDQVHAQLTRQARKNTFLFSWLPIKPQKTIIRGIYLWGDVGRGKTMLMDTFYDSLPAIVQRQRVHFHRFMQNIHHELKSLKNKRNPLSIIASKLASTTRVLCLDEFHVNDIADAMLLAGLFEALFNKGVCLITTSNRPPDDLYKDGLQRARFLPAIALLKKHTDVLNLDNHVDYRLKTLQSNETYFSPATQASDQQMQTLFDQYTINTSQQTQPIIINQREIAIRARADGVIWFDFSELCEGPRAQNDYLDLACEYHSLMLSNIPLMDHQNENAARRFLNLLDILYDHRVKLIASAAAPMTHLYTGKKLAFEFERATSRLIEMQSEQYLKQAHMP